MGVIVVGVDHSEGAKAALQFAIDEVKLRQSTLRAVHAWQFSFETAGLQGGLYPAVLPDLSDMHRAAEAALEAALGNAVPDLLGIALERRVVEGAPGAVLVAESQAAELLVVGSRGHGGFAGLLLGSVSAQCAHHAACPVVIIPHKRGG
jgi:nucleotide-binding universal stress UspA family protein